MQIPYQKLTVLFYTNCHYPTSLLSGWGTDTWIKMWTVPQFKIYFKTFKSSFLLFCYQKKGRWAWASLLIALSLGFTWVLSFLEYLSGTILDILKADFPSIHLWFPHLIIECPLLVQILLKNHAWAASFCSIIHGDIYTFIFLYFLKPKVRLANSKALTKNA